MQIIMPKTARFFKMDNTYVNLAGCSRVEVSKNPDTDYWQLEIKTIDGDTYEWCLPRLNEEDQSLWNPYNIDTFKHNLNQFMSKVEQKETVFDCTLYKLTDEQAKEYWENMWSED